MLQTAAVPKETRNARNVSFQEVPTVRNIDLVDRLVPDPANTLVVKTPKGDLVLVATKRTPEEGDTVLVNSLLKPYQKHAPASGVAYCVIHFL